MRNVSLLTLACVVCLAVPAVSAQTPLSQYRGVTLGDSLEVALERLQLTSASVKIVHARPALIQEVTWRPRALVSGTDEARDSVSEMVLIFHAGRLARVTANYDRERTQGLTNSDLMEAMTALYGASMLISTPRVAANVSPADRLTIGRWEDEDTLLILWREQYPSRVGLAITSNASNAALLQAIADGLQLQADEAPARDLARRSAEAAAIEARAEKIRLDNKAKFKP